MAKGQEQLRAVEACRHLRMAELLQRLALPTLGMSHSAALNPLKHRLNMLGVFARHPVHAFHLGLISPEHRLNRINDATQTPIGEPDVSRQEGMGVFEMLNTCKTAGSS